MNKKGFTILELLTIIIIIGIVGSAASIGINKIIINKRETEYQSFINEIKNVTCNMASLTTYENEIVTIDNLSLSECKNNSLCKISTDFLIEHGLISEQLKNPKDQTTLKNKHLIIDVKWEDGLKNCYVEGE